MRRFLLVWRFFVGVMRSIIVYKMTPQVTTVSNEDGYQIRAIELKIPAKNDRDPD